MNILLADDHDLFRDAIELLLKRDLKASNIDHADSYASVRDNLEQNKQDLVLLDYQMPGMKGIDSIRDLIQIQETPFIILSGFVDKPLIQKLFESDVNGVIPKTIAGETLGSAIELVLKGGKYIPDILLNEDQHDDFKRNNSPKLTQRESDVLHMLVEGMSNKEIARGLNLEESTVKLHIRALCSKLDSKNRTGVVVSAFKLGLISINS
ncbi:response regulator transcription factor [Kangiella sp. HZ709]|uniref:response regulator transcription factor n=1 Tax=Kangiella sp. HZ709 TaxID=2666328 RepID=UPI0012B13A39|nr:response regulator transcription factor [Kangiella sp. HZ709]MRX27261.1 response regulator [Kangiella sp. HZ709]